MNQISQLRTLHYINLLSLSVTKYAQHTPKMRERAERADTIQIKQLNDQDLPAFPGRGYQCKYTFMRELERERRSIRNTF